MKVRINLNERVKFKLSERGKEIYRHRYDGYGFEYDREPKLDDDGYMSMQLWTFMQIFGEHMIMGMSEVLNPLEIIYEENDAESATTTDCISRQAAIHDVSTVLWHMPNELYKNLNSFDFVKEIVTEALSETPSLPPATSTEQQEKEHDGKSICHTCATNNCPFQSGIYRNNCDFYTSVNKQKELYKGGDKE